HATWRSPARTEPLHGTAAVRRLYDAIILYDGSPCTRHVVTNLVVELRGADRAGARSYFTVFQGRPDFPLQPIIVGRYHDAFARVDGAWRFADSVILSDLIGDLSRHLRAFARSTSLLAGPWRGPRPCAGPRWSAGPPGSRRTADPCRRWRVSSPRGPLHLCPPRRRRRRRRRTRWRSPRRCRERRR